MKEINFDPGKAVVGTLTSEFKAERKEKADEINEWKKQCGVQHKKYKQEIEKKYIKNFSKTRQKCIEILSPQNRDDIPIKKKALELLILLLKNDSYKNEDTANGLVDDLISLKNLLGTIQVPSLEPLFLQAFISALDSVIGHYHNKSLPVIPDSIKTDLESFTTQERDRNVHNQTRLSPTIAFRVKYATYALRNLITEKTSTKKLIESSKNFISACQVIFTLDVMAAYENLKTVINDLKKNESRKWFLGVLLQKELFGKAIQDEIALNTLIEFINDWGLPPSTLNSYFTGWKFLYGSIENLTDIVIQTENPEIRKRTFKQIVDLIAFDKYRFKASMKKSMDNNWKVRWAVIEGLYKIWKRCPDYSIKDLAAKLLGDRKQDEKNDKIYDHLNQITKDDKRIKRIWRGANSENIRKEKKEKKEIELQKKNLKEEEERQNQISLDLSKQDDENSTLREEMRNLTKIIQIHSDKIKHLGENETELANKRSLLEQKEKTLQTNLENLQNEKIQFAKDQEKLKIKDENFLQKAKEQEKQFAEKQTFFEQQENILRIDQEDLQNKKMKLAKDHEELKIRDEDLSQKSKELEEQLAEKQNLLAQKENTLRIDQEDLQNQKTKLEKDQEELKIRDEELSQKLKELEKQEEILNDEVFERFLHEDLIRKANLKIQKLEEANAQFIKGFMPANKPEKFTFNECPLTPQDLSSFLHENLLSLDLRRCPNIDTSIVIEISRKCTKIKELYLSECPKITSIEKGFFSRKPINFDHLEIFHINDCQNLKIFNLRAPNLQELEASNNKNLKIKLLDIPSSTWVNFDNCPNVDLEKLTLPSIETHNKYYCEIFIKLLYPSYEKLVQTLLKEKTNIPAAWETENKTGVIGILKSSFIRNLCHQIKPVNHEFHNKQHFSEFTVSLFRMSHSKNPLNSLDFTPPRYNHGPIIGIEELIILGQILTINTTLQHLDLSNNQLGNKEKIPFIKSLQYNSSLISLNLAENKMENEAIIHLAKSLENKYALGRLNLAGNKIGNKGLFHLMKSLEHKSSFSFLNLSSNEIENDGIVHLATSLEYLPSLYELNLAGNKIGNDGMVHFANSLKKHSSLENLNLAKNELGNEEIFHLAKSFEKNSSLRNLNLAGNKIGNEGIFHLANSFEKNSALDYLILVDNKFGKEGILHLANSFEKNPFPRFLHLNNIQLRGEEAEALIVLLKHPTLEIFLDIFQPTLEAFEVFFDSFEKNIHDNSSFYIRNKNKSKWRGFEEIEVSFDSLKKRIPTGSTFYIKKTNKTYKFALELDKIDLNSYPSDYEPQAIKKILH